MENDQELRRVLIRQIQQGIEKLLLTDTVSEEAKLKIAQDMLEIISKDKGKEGI